MIDNPLAQYYLSVLRDRRTTPKSYRDALRKLGFIMGYEISRRLKWTRAFVDTGLGRAEGLYPARPLLIVGVLGASVPFMHGVWDAMPWAGLGLIGARRRVEGGAVKVEVFYERLPDDLSLYNTIVVDPILATGATMAEVTRRVMARGCRILIAATIVASRRGLERYAEMHPDVDVFVVGIDPILDDRSYFVLPGIGDAGERSLSADFVTLYDGSPATDGMA